MPYYEYIAENPEAGCDFCSQPVTLLQKLSDPPMERCPYCAQPTRRLISAPGRVGSVIGAAPGEREIAKAGFTQYRKSESGVYEKTVGDGPDLIRSN